jgi:UDP-N-acetylglucosamine 2-epimerase
MRVLTVFGTRPEAIKMAPVVSELRRRGVQQRICVTAQHREMLDQVNALFGIHVDIDLDLMRPGQRLEELTARILTAMGGVLEREKPDLVLVHGDTTTAFATALAAFYRDIPVGHVEAGLRTYERHQPFPEETNRTFIAQMGSLHFAPTPRSQANLLSERVAPESILITGNTAIDALLQMSARVRPEDARVRVPAGHRSILLTAHRRESFGAPLEATFLALRRIVERFPDVEVVYPVHPNPHVQEPAHRLLGGHARIHLIEPQPYHAFVALMKQAELIITDSGGIQEEAPALGKPVLVLRNVTERPEAVEAGTVRLVGTAPDRIEQAVTTLLREPEERELMARAINPYGDGRAAERIVSHLLGESPAPWQSPAERVDESVRKDETPRRRTKRVANEVRV